MKKLSSISFDNLGMKKPNPILHAWLAIVFLETHVLLCDILKSQYRHGFKLKTFHYIDVAIKLKHQ